MTHLGEHGSQSHELIERAVLAPSSHNTQPWRFRMGDGVIDLLADRTRALPVNDPHDRELTISCGAALLNLRIAASGAGLGASVRLLPDDAEGDWLARVAIAAGSDTNLSDAELVHYIERRRTYRKRFADKPVDQATVRKLQAAAELEGTWLYPLLSEQARDNAAALVAEGDAIQWDDPSWRRELAVWMHPRRHGDGLTVPGLAAPVAQLVVRTFDLGGGVGANDKALAEASPLLAVLGTKEDSVRGWLLAGQALQRLLLTACRLGLQASYLNQPVQVTSLRPKLQQLTDREGSPQLLLRFGYPIAELPPTPRRPIDDVIDGDCRDIPGNAGGSPAARS